MYFLFIKNDIILISYLNCPLAFIGFDQYFGIDAMKSGGPQSFGDIEESCKDVKEPTCCFLVRMLFDVNDFLLNKETSFRELLQKYFQSIVENSP